MLWVDYREKLGIGLMDNDKFKLLKNKITNFLTMMIDEDVEYEDSSYFAFCMMTGTEYVSGGEPIEEISYCFSTASTIKEFFSLYIAFVNTLAEYDDPLKLSRERLLKLLCIYMDDSKIGYEIINDKESNQFFVFPQGVKILDDSLVSDPLEWLFTYPNTHKIYSTALKQYSNGEYIRDIADNFRKALEEFLKEFLGNTKNLANNIQEVGGYLKTQGADSEIANILVKVISCYDTLNNKIAKHNDKVDKRFLEFLMYQTGIFIRMLIVVKKYEA